MKRILIGTILLILPAALSYAGTSEGKELYTSKCAPCHGPNGEGKEAVAKMLKVTLPHLGSKEVQSMSDSDLQKVILHGKGKMRPASGINEKQAGDIVSYVRTLKQ